MSEFILRAACGDPVPETEQDRKEGKWEPGANLGPAPIDRSEHVRFCTLAQGHGAGQLHRYLELNEREFWANS